MKTFKKIVFLILFLSFSFSIFSQEHILLSYQRNFVRASLAGKNMILRDAATDSRSEEFICSLYVIALQFVMDNIMLLPDDADFINLTGTVVRGLKNAAYKESSVILWNVFLSFRDPYTRADIIDTLNSFGKENWYILNLNQYITSQNNFFQEGYLIDYITLSACISAVGKMGDSSSYAPLFTAYTLGYPQNINNEVRRNMELLGGNFPQFLTNIMRSSPPNDKLAALRLGSQSAKLGSVELGQIAQLALESGFDADVRDEKNANDTRQLRYNAIPILTRLKWTRANAGVIRHFYLVQEDFREQPELKTALLDAIYCLGAMGTYESAQILTLQLGFYNSRTEHSGEYDPEIILALIQSLGEIGDKTAFDYLFYISYLNYPEQIKAAAREALNRLRW